MLGKKMLNLFHFYFPKIIF